MNVYDFAHGRWMVSRRVRVLSEIIADFAPPGPQVLDIGSGDGQISASVMRLRPDLQIQGVDVLVRPDAAIATMAYDGLTLPFPDSSFDGALAIDMLHHCENPTAMLVEITRVVRHWVLVKDHVLLGILAGATLRFMDRVGNARHGVALPFNYLDLRQWNDAFDATSLRITRSTQNVPLYPWPANWLFGRRLHMVALMARGDVLEERKDR